MGPSLTTRPLLGALVLLWVAAGAPSIAVAQPAPDLETIERARALNKKGEDLFAIAEYDRAIAAFKEAYELAPTPGLLFNIAQAYRLKGPESCKSAVRFYRNYLLALPDGPNRAVVDKHLAELEPCPDLPAPDRRVDPPPPSSPSPPVVTVSRPAAPSRWPPYATIAGGGALATAGAVLYFVADRKYRSLEDGECARHDCPESTWTTYRSMERVGVGLIAVGTAVAVTGIVWAVVRRSPDDGGPNPAATWAPWATRSGGGLAVGGTF